MRIVAGKYKGRKLVLGSEFNLRPTSEKVREAIFSSLQSHINLANARVLDLFAGSGALGFESLSRGANFVLFIEQDRQLCDLVRKFSSDLSLSAKIRCGDVFKVLSNLALTEQRAFDLVFADPPYANFCCRELIYSLHAAKLVHDDSLLVYESSSISKVNLMQESILSDDRTIAKLIKQRSYGKTIVSYFSFLEV